MNTKIPTDLAKMPGQRLRVPHLIWVSADTSPIYWGSMIVEVFEKRAKVLLPTGLGRPLPQSNAPVSVPGLCTKVGKMGMEQEELAESHRPPLPYLARNKQLFELCHVGAGREFSLLLLKARCKDDTSFPQVGTDEFPGRGGMRVQRRLHCGALAAFPLHPRAEQSQRWLAQPRANMREQGQVLETRQSLAVAESSGCTAGGKRLQRSRAQRVCRPHNGWKTPAGGREERRSNDDGPRPAIRDGTASLLLQQWPLALNWPLGRRID